MKRLTVLGLTIVLAACAYLSLINRKNAPVAASFEATESTVASPARPFSEDNSALSLEPAPAAQVAPAFETPQLRELDARLADLKRELLEKERLLETDHIKDQLNQKNLPKSTRLIYFDRIREVSRLQRQVIDLRFQQIALLQEIVRKQRRS